MVDGLVEPPVEHVGGGHGGVQPSPLAAGAGHLVQAVQRRLQQAHPGRQIVAEQDR